MALCIYWLHKFMFCCYLFPQTCGCYLSGPEAAEGRAAGGIRQSSRVQIFLRSFEHCSGEPTVLSVFLLLVSVLGLCAVHFSEHIMITTVNVTFFMRSVFFLWLQSPAGGVWLTHREVQSFFLQHLPATQSCWVDCERWKNIQSSLSDLSKDASSFVTWSWCIH